MHAFDRQTDRRTDSFLLTRPPCIQCSAVKTVSVCTISVWCAVVFLLRYFYFPHTHALRHCNACTCVLLASSSVVCRKPTFFYLNRCNFI